MSTLYYSRYSPQCAKFLKKLKSENMLKMFDQYFCIDNRNNNELPPWLVGQKLVIVVPESDKPLFGNEVFTWLTYKLNEKYKERELGTLNQNDGNFVSLNKHPDDITLDSENYISIHNIDKPIKPEGKFQNAETMDVAKRMEIMEQERAQLMNQQKGQAPRQPNFQDPQFR